MALFIWDASALAKRYTAEMGRETANALFATIPAADLASTPWGYAETYSIVLRRMNTGVLDAKGFTLAVTALEAEVVNSADFTLFTVTDTAIFRSVAMMRKHNLNATDAAILTVVLEVANSPDAPLCVLVASDKRLLRAAELEGLRTLNPEVMAPTDVPAFLAML
jgi:predicted nucleic acid-binding protein